MGTKDNISVSLVISVLLFGTVGTVLAGTIYVDANAAPGGNGTTWGTAYKYLQDAFYKPPTSGDEIWVAAGTYKPDQDEGSNVTPGDRMATFEFKDGVSVYGGFPIGGGTWEERDPNLHETILSGDLNGDDGADFVNNEENSFHVVSITSLSGTITMAGFTVKNGNAWTGGIYGDDTLMGGGIYNISTGTVVLSNLKITQNMACFGAGLACLNKTGSSTIQNTFITSCEFYGNKHERVTNDLGGGAAISLHGYSPSIINCVIHHNISVRAGAIYSFSFGGWPEAEIYSNPQIINCTFFANSARGQGGVMYNRGQGYPTFTNCSLVGNKSKDGGAYYTSGVFVASYGTFTNCSIISNSADRNGGGIVGAVNHTVNNCIVWGNKDSSGINESSQITPIDITVISSCIQDDDPDDGYIPFGGAANNNIDDNPSFVRDPCDGGDGWGVGDNDDFGNLRLQYVAPCIDTADNTAVPADTEDLDEDLNTTEPIPYDLDNHPRIVDGDCNTTEVVDMGAYEFAYLYLGDFAGGCDIDFADFAVFALAWLTEEGQAGYDPNCDIALPYDGAIDEKDLQVFSDNWLLGR